VQSVLPEVPEAGGRKLCVPNRVLDVLVSEVVPVAPVCRGRILPRSMPIVLTAADDADLCDMGRAPCASQSPQDFTSCAGPEHGRAIPLADIAAMQAPNASEGSSNGSTEPFFYHAQMNAQAVQIDFERARNLEREHG
jgi:hypothetical protein